MITQRGLKKILKYSPGTGEFAWREFRRNNSVKPGQKAGCSNGEGYRVIQIDGVIYSAHRLAWLYMLGQWPPSEIDHINGMRGDNCWGNLRLATATTNQHNRQGPNRNNTTGYLGVFRSGEKGFRARIKFNGRRHDLGSYPTAEEASKVYDKVKRQLHPGGALS